MPDSAADAHAAKQSPQPMIAAVAGGGMQGMVFSGFRAHGIACSTKRKMISWAMNDNAAWARIIIA
ncbi:MAG: hypothetical protein CFE31_16315 [Rhizobiales bacterium PAR1]|nr:MAG: hypothetical protein CFE31_16315 [Rhizobiales bacterium PAR1]